MAEEQAGSEEEVQRVFDALDAVEAIEDPKSRARAISAFLGVQQPRLRKLSKLRRDYVLEERAKKVSRRQIAEDIGVSPSTVQDIEFGYSGSGKTRPRKEKGEGAGDGGSASS
ncbi:helix-turn-helix domain-containing protein [Streptomyces sp. NPDC056441]|uniref:helix-turn-helix domain-containing protein n=1 Tax=Streptomyces sp. NPDC056441 TaxID=3345817 RepID=UPI00367E874C